MEPQENLAGHFPSSTAHGARLRRHCQPWPRRSGTSRQWLLPAVAPSFSNGGRARLDGRPATPPHDMRCSTVWLACEQRQQKATWCQWLDPSLPASTVGGPALEPSNRRALRSQRRQWSLPPPFLCMSMCYGRSRSTCHMDGVHLLTRRFLHGRSCRKMPLAAVEPHCAL